MSMFTGLARIVRDVALCGAVGFGLMAAAQAAPDKRVALVMGIGAYKQVPALPNPVMDGKAMAESLKRLGFEVVEGYDLDRAGMDQKLVEFTVKLEGAQTALLFFAGHGIAVGGENYLIPADAKLENERLVDLQTLPLGKVLKQMQIDAKTSIIVLDACRDNPFAKELSRSARTRSLQPNGLATIDVKQGSGTLLAFATDPGAVALDGKPGDNSPFTTALIAHMETPGISISQVFDRVRGDVYRSTNEKQRPWVNTSIIGEYFLKPAEAPGTQQAALNQGVVPGTTPGVAPMPLSAAENAQMELRLWEEAKQDNSADSYKVYLARYPQGQFAQMAKLRIAKMDQAAQPAAPGAAPKAGSAQTEAALGLTKEEISELQLRLRLIGFEPGSTGGKWTPGSRKAISGWQGSKQLPATGFLTTEQRVALMEDSQVVYDRHANTRTLTPQAPVAAPRPVAPAIRARQEERRRVVHQPPPQQPRQQPRQGGGGDAIGAGILGGIVGGVIGGVISRRR